MWFAAYPWLGRYLHGLTILSRLALRGLRLQAAIESEDRCSAGRKRRRHMFIGVPAQIGLKCMHVVA
ncbi:hypothetical protein C0Q88_16790 [Ralstonia pickettii]|uniref:Uncharacterized protein n=1 Tax=Ralstonia pickettii TaxID=329 RepID=A0A2N4TNH6_RALPI|nr:hypothetical protein C0Q88_16790 [Ralstonia pickettii]